MSRYWIEYEVTANGVTELKQRIVKARDIHDAKYKVYVYEKELNQVQDLTILMVNFEEM